MGLEKGRNPCSDISRYVPLGFASGRVDTCCIAPKAHIIRVPEADQQEPLLCFDVNSAEMVLAAGTELSVGDEAKVLFW